MSFPGAFSHWRYNALVPLLLARSLTSTAGLGPVQHTVTLQLLLFVPTLMALYLWSVFSICAYFALCIYPSVWLLVEESRDGEVMWSFRSLWSLSRRGSNWLGVMDGNHTGGLEFWKMEAKFVLHSSKSSCSQTITSNVVGVDGWKLWNARLWCRISSWWTAVNGQN